jgi:uncharacterized membrane protein YdjX (TVP38/TMEM64 family)
MTLFIKSLQKKTGLRRYIGPKRIILLVVILLFLFISWDYYRAGALNPVVLQKYLDTHPIGVVLLFLGIYAISVIAVLPSLPLNLAAGFFWGGLLGGLYSTIAVTLGGWISFYLARVLVGRPFMKKFQNRWLNVVQSEFEKSQWKFVAFARINPIIPTGPLNYLLGLTSLTNKDFLWTSFVFLLPPSVAVAYVGDIMQTFATQQSDVNGIVRGILMVSALFTLVVGMRLISKLHSKA